MHVYYAAEKEKDFGRYHPWTESEHDPSHRYYDFLSHPELIRTSLEDVLPLGESAAANAIYEMLEWLNGPDSLFETNDFGLRSLMDSEEKQFPQSLKFEGRVHLFLRDHTQNTTGDAAIWLSNAFLNYLNRVDLAWTEGCVGIARQPVYFEAMSREGWMQELNLWAFGNTDQETTDALVRCVKNVHQACKMIDERIRTDLAKHRETRSNAD